MKHLLRPYRSVGVAVLMGVGAGLAMAPPGAAAQAGEIVQILQEPSPLLGSSSSQGYLGVDVADVDQDKAQNLKLKEVRGAVITLIDHDAPAGQIGLKVNDVVIQLNGQNVEGAEQLKRMLREIPPGRKVSLEFSRDGNVQTVAVELVDHRVLGHDVWNRIGNGGDVFAQGSSMGILPGAGDAGLPGSFHMPFFGSTLNVGAMVEPLTSQMAEYLGVPNGLMIKQVAHKSEAATAGFKAFDVILKVGSDAVTTLSDWDRALRANQGKPVQVTILRDKKQQTLTLQVDSKRKTGELDMERVFPNEDGVVVAEIDPQLALGFAWDDQAAAEAMRKQAERLQEQLKAGGIEQFQMSQQQADEMRKQAEKLRDSLNDGSFKIAQKQTDELKKQMEQFRENFKPGDFKVDPEQMEQFKQQMDAFSKNFKAEDFKFDQKQMDELKKQMEEFRKGCKTEEPQVAPY